MEKETIQIRNTEMEVEFDYYPYIPPSRNLPSEDELVEILSVVVKEVDVTELLSKEIIVEIENQLKHDRRG